MEATTMTRVLNFLNISALVISHLLLRIAQNGICFAYVFKHLVSIQALFFIPVGMLVRMPLEGSAFVSFLDLFL